MARLYILTNQIVGKISRAVVIGQHHPTNQQTKKSLASQSNNRTEMVANGIGR